MARNLNSPKNKIVESKVLADVFSNDSAKDDDDDGTFFFETDYAALKGNPDYLKLMRTLVILQAQRTKILQVGFLLFHFKKILEPRKMRAISAHIKT